MSLRQVLESHACAHFIRRATFHPEDAIQIFSSPRGGSTWLMSLLSQLPGVASLWEPFHSKKGVVPKHWGARPHPDALNEGDSAILGEVLAGRRVNAWTCSRTPLQQAKNASQLLIKYVRGNRLLPFILDKWNLKHKPILLMRHPLDVAISQLRAFGERPRDVRVNKVYPGHTKLQKRWAELSQVADPLERHLHLWCLLNAALWEDMSRDHRVIAVHYHDLAVQPEKELYRIIEALDLTSARARQSTQNFVSSLDPRKTSDTDFKGDFLANNHDQLWKNLGAIDDERKAILQSVLDQHGFSMYSMNDVAPQRA